MVKYQHGLPSTKGSEKDEVVLTIVRHPLRNLGRRDLLVGRGRPSHLFSLDPDDAQAVDLRK